jgi:catecholate siderophore receptor
MKKRHSKPLGYLTFAVLSASFAQTNAEDLKVAALNINRVEVAAKRISDTKPVKGYQATKSSTATKTDTPLMDVPQSVSVITQEQINDQSVQSMSDAVRYVPGVTASQGEGNRDALNFRGSGVTTGDFYLDGIRDDVQTYRDFYNTDRIEVLKGPNGMIFGRGASGGAINRVSKEAGWDPVREIKLSYGAYNQKRTSIDIGNGINDLAAFRLNAVYEESDSYRSGLNLKRYGVNPTFTITPTDNTKITFGA